MNDTRSNPGSATPIGQAPPGMPQDVFEVLEARAAEEAAALDRVEDLAAQMAEASRPIWRWGDGKGGHVQEVLERAFRDAGMGGDGPPSRPKPYRKKPIPDDLRWEVWERDNFTCQGCGTRRNLSADHVIPEVRGGPTTLANLQTLCRPCNARKGSR